jgi:epoxyqueuosine reductase
MAILISEPSVLLRDLAAEATALGLSVMKVTEAKLPDHVGERLRSFVEQKFHGDMGWMAETLERRVSPDAMWTEAKSAIVFAMPYGPEIDPMLRLEDKTSGVISVYGLNRDYHDVFKGKLKLLGHWLARQSGAEVKVFVDTAPLMEKPLAQQSGLGWQGKHTNLVSRQLGSWFFIGSILTTLELSWDESETDHCGSCRNCLDVCPTKAFPAPYQLDGRRCISYLTIEHKGPIPEEFRKAMGNRIYGCDDCLAVCPWNKFAKAASDNKLRAREELIAPELSNLLQLDDVQFRLLFSGSPVKRIGRDRFVRNCLIAAGNSGDENLLPVVMSLITDPSAIVRGAAVWAFRQLQDEDIAKECFEEFTSSETNLDVLIEWL